MSTRAFHYAESERLLRKSHEVEPEERGFLIGEATARAILSTVADGVEANAAKNAQALERQARAAEGPL